MTELVVLKSPPFGTPGDGPLPYRADQLRAHGFELVWDDRRAGLTGRRAALVGRTEALATPWLQTWHLRRRIRRAPVTLAFFESEGHGVALARHLGLLRRTRLVIMSCWLADLAPRFGRVRRAVYRWLYRRVDAVTVYSANQVPILHETLGIPLDKLHTIPFGVDVDELEPLERRDDGYLVAVGRDAARDWPTLYAGVAGCGRRVVVLARPSKLPEGGVPDEIEMLGYVERTRYLDLLAGCSGVLIITREAAYPSGQTVMLEALGLGKKCIVSDTAAMASFGAGLPATRVPVGDAKALSTAIAGLDSLPRPVVARSALDTSAMWAALAPILREGTDA